MGTAFTSLWRRGIVLVLVPFTLRVFNVCVTAEERNTL
jgi:hypothetical protein